MPKVKLNPLYIKQKIAQRKMALNKRLNQRVLNIVGVGPIDCLANCNDYLANCCGCCDQVCCSQICVRNPDGDFELWTSDDNCCFSNASGDGCPKICYSNGDWIPYCCNTCCPNGNIPSSLTFIISSTECPLIDGKTFTLNANSTSNFGGNTGDPAVLVCSGSTWSIAGQGYPIDSTTIYLAPFAVSTVVSLTCDPFELVLDYRTAFCGGCGCSDKAIRLTIS